MSTAQQYIATQKGWIGRTLKDKGDTVMLTEQQAKYVPVKLDPKWMPPVEETDVKDENPDDGKGAPKEPANSTKTAPKK